jgi:hypothetical protein
MNINRYMLIGREHKLLFEKISKWNFKWAVGVTCASSALINIGHGFQYSFNDGTRYVFGINYFYVQETYPDDFSIDDFLPLYVYTLGCFMINYLLFFVVNTWVEG